MAVTHRTSGQGLARTLEMCRGGAEWEHGGENNNLEEWILRFVRSSQQTIIHLKLRKGTKYVSYFNSNAREQLKRLRALINIAWLNCDRIDQLGVSRFVKVLKGYFRIFEVFQCFFMDFEGFSKYFIFYLVVKIYLSYSS